MRRRTVVIYLVLLLTITDVFAFGQKEHEGDTIMPAVDYEKRYPYEQIDPALLNRLNAKEAQVILDKGTEWAFTGAYTDTTSEGTYYCRQCDSPLYVSQDKFHSGCGWPSFDDELPDAVDTYPDADGQRTEIVCATCKGHLGHVFYGERFTEKNTRHCVNSISMVFREEPPKAKATFAGGCFWGVEYLFETLDGVYEATSGYTGGTAEHPTYTDVLTHKTGHLEAVEVVYNPSIISYEKLARYFFEIHDPTQVGGQGPDIGNQYLSAVFYRSRHEYDVTLKLIGLLEEKGYAIATQVRPAAIFWPAEEYHQDYYEHKGTLPYCHAYTKRF